MVLAKDSLAVLLACLRKQDCGEVGEWGDERSLGDRGDLDSCSVLQAWSNSGDLAIDIAGSSTCAQGLRCIRDSVRPVNFMQSPIIFYKHALIVSVKCMRCESCVACGDTNIPQKPYVAESSIQVQSSQQAWDYEIERGDEFLHVPV